jgi:hypothetical protein
MLLTFARVMLQKGRRGAQTTRTSVLPRCAGVRDRIVTLEEAPITATNREGNRRGGTDLRGRI